MISEIPTSKRLLIEVPAVTPFSFGIHASKIKESMMMENPEEAIERLYRAMREKLEKPVE